MVLDWHSVVLGSIHHGSSPVCDQVSFIFLITGNTSNLFTWVMAFISVCLNVFYVFSLVFCCLFSVRRAEVCRLLLYA